MSETMHGGSRLVWFAASPEYWPHLDSATRPRDLDLPGYRLHPLKGDLEGLWSVRVSGNWRIVFRIERGDVFDVNLIDYH